MTDQLVIGILLALLVETAFWIKVRWEFDDAACSRSWQFTSVGIGLATVLIWLDGDRYTALPNLLTWLPMLLVPIQFIQSFGMRDALPLNTFSYLAKKRRKRNLRLGLTETPLTINFGNIYFASILIAATLGRQSNRYGLIFLAGMLILIAWRFYFMNSRRPIAMFFSLAVIAGIALLGQAGIQRAQEWLSNGYGSQDSKFNPNSVSTSIGRPGLVQLSADIVWRLRTVGKNPPPRYLRTATFNNFRASTWENQRVAGLDFKDLDTRETQNGEAYFILSPDGDLGAMNPDLPRFSLRGAAAAETPLPLPGDAASLTRFALDGAERNSFGCVRIFPKTSVVEGTVLWHNGTNPEVTPILSEDLRIPISEQKLLKQLAKEIGLKKENPKRKQESLFQIYSEKPKINFVSLSAPLIRNPIITADQNYGSFIAKQPLKEKLVLIQNWFMRNFQYSRNLTIRSSRTVTIPPTAITQFLTKTRTGHCEYFATAAVFLLREAGIPARYTIGYAVVERDNSHQEFVIRGTHAHAWCRVWNQESGLWQDLDTTPPSGLETATPPMSFAQNFNDALQRAREDFFLWRNRPNNRLAVNLSMALIALAVGAFLTKRLWKSKQRVGRQTTLGGHESQRILTSLHELELPARKRLGPRPLGQPYAEWLLLLAPSLTNPGQLEQAVNLHQKLRFDPAPAAPDDRVRLEILVKEIAADLKLRPGRVA